MALCEAVVTLGMSGPNAKKCLGKLSTCLPTPGAVLRCAACVPQPFIDRSGPDILVRDLPPKLEVVLNLAPTATQSRLLQGLLNILEHDRNTLRDTEVREGRRHALAPMQSATTSIGCPTKAAHEGALRLQECVHELLSRVLCCLPPATSLCS